MRQPTTDRRGHPRRPPAPDLHLLPPGAGPEIARRPDPAHPRRPDHRRDRPRLSGPRADDGPAPVSRAKAKIAAAGIPFAVPGPEDLARAAEFGPDGGLPDLQRRLYRRRRRPAAATCATRRSFWPGCSTSLHPDEAEVEGCLALLLLTHARRAARGWTPTGPVVPLDAAGPQPVGPAPHRARAWRCWTAPWPAARPGPFQIKAAIAALHVAAHGRTDWPQIAALYDSLLRMEPTPVVPAEPRRRAGRGGQPAGRAARDRPAVPAPGRLPAVPRRPRRTAGPRRQHRPTRCAAYDRAIALAASSADAAFLGKRATRRQRQAPTAPAGRKKRPSIRSAQVQQGGMKDKRKLNRRFEAEYLDATVAIAQTSADMPAIAALPLCACCMAALIIGFSRCVAQSC